MTSPGLSSILCITYNHEKFIAQAIESFLMQRVNFPFEVIISDDCSTDSTLEIIKRYKERNPGLIKALHSKENAGPAVNWYKAFKACTGKYIAICEGDDYWTDPDKLQKQIDFLESNTEYSVCYHNSIIVDENNNIISQSRLKEQNKRDYSSEELIKACKIQTQTLCFRNMIEEIPEEYFRAFGGDKFITSLLGNYGKGKYLSDIKPSAFRLHKGGVNGGEKDLYAKYKRHMSTRIALYQYYERIGKAEYSDYFLQSEVYPVLGKLIKHKKKKNDDAEKESLIGKYYSGNNADAYESKRRNNPKWQFEDETLNKVLNEIKTEIKDLIDAPVGSGRFLDFYKTLGKEKNIYGIDYSVDMLKVASEKCSMPNVSFIQKDIINNRLEVTADLSVCYRFLNLVNHDEAVKTISNLLLSAKKYSIIAVRTVGDDYEGEMFIENKIYLHKWSDIKRIISRNNFEVEMKFDFPDEREGQYSILLCRKITETYPILSSRINKNLNLVLTYGLGSPEGKIYQVKDIDHAEFIKKISAREEIKKYFPEVNSVRNDFVNASWINGEIAESSEWIDVISMLADIQSLSYSGSSSFDYVEDIVLPRFYLTHPLIGFKLYGEITSIIKEESGRYSYKVSHPDVIPGNVVNVNGQMKIIDNELLCYSVYHRIDILNLLYNLKPENRLPVFLKYCSLTGLSIETLKNEFRFLQALWLARQIGSFIIKGKPGSAVNLLNSYLKGENILPVDFTNLSAASGSNYSEFSIKDFSMAKGQLQ